MEGALRLKIDYAKKINPEVDLFDSLEPAEFKKSRENLLKLIELYRKDGVVTFVGAGTSKPLGILDWEKIFHFILLYVDRNEFWEDKFVVPDRDWKATHLWVAGQVAELIQDGTKDDSWAFSEEHFKKAEEIVELAKKYISEGILPADKLEDAIHAAAATMFEMDALISWNLKHLANLKKMEMINGINMKEGYLKRLELITPMEVSDEEL